MTSLRVPPEHAEDLRAAVRAFARAPGPASFGRVCDFLDAHGKPDRRVPGPDPVAQADLWRRRN